MSRKNHQKEPVLIGRIVSTFGLRGQVKVEPLSNIAQRFLPGTKLLLEGRPHEILESRFQKGRYILRLEGIKRIEEAEVLQWKELYARAEDEPELDEDEYMIDDLVGLKVIDLDGQVLGVVDDVQTFPAHDILIVGKLLIPAVQEFVRLVDFESETITVQLIDGMLDSNEG